MTLIVYSHAAELEFLQFFIAAMKAVAPESPASRTIRRRSSSRWPTPEVLRARRTDAGLKDVRIERTAERPAFASGQEMWDWLYHGNPIAEMVVGHLSEEQQATLRQVLDGMLRERAGVDGRAVITNPVHIGIGTKRPTGGLLHASLPSLPRHAEISR